jgi:DNA helicase TIP49 (TBP-interacting protein)
MDLFDHALKERMKTEAPLAARMRPRTIDEYVGQRHIVGEGRLLRRAIEADRLFSSIILWGPPGTGKTTLAMVIANHTKSHFETISAVLNGIADLRKVVAEAQERRKLYKIHSVLFEKDVLTEIAELEANQVRLPNIEGIRAWFQTMLSVENLKDWLTNDDPNIIRSVLAGRIKVLCPQRAYKATEPAPTVELCL